ncbi:hypothetical protein CSB11_02805 [Candidatus Campbellbacteria bacterium]|nr:MAG: hypothetical protein CSB11_02805 [Candidatus Campbellbacteria bacterium]
MKTNLKKILKSILILSFAVPVLAFADFNISEYKYFKEIQKPQTKQQGDFFFILDDQIYKHTNDFLSDIRIVDGNKKQIPYKVQTKKGYTERFVKKTEISFKKLDQNTYLLDFGEVPIGHWNLDVKTKSTGFRRVVDVYASDLPDSRFISLNIDKKGDVITSAPDFVDKNILHKHTKQRYLKLVFNGSQGSIKVDGFVIKKDEEKFIQGEVVEYPTTIQEYTNTQQEDILEYAYLIDMQKEKLPLSYFVFDTDLKNYDRNITIYSSDNKNALIYDPKNKYSQDTPYWKEVYRGKLYKQIYTDKMRINLNGQRGDNKRYYLVVVQNDDNVQLNILKANAFGYLKKLYLSGLDFEKNKYFVYFGGKNGIVPKYDLTGFTQNDLVELNLKSIQNNLNFQKERKSIFTERPWIFYLAIFAIVLILFWFVYKIIKEVQNKDKENKDIINKID